MFYNLDNLVHFYKGDCHDQAKYRSHRDSTRNAKASANFYQQLFGWHMERVEEMDYTMWDPHEVPVVALAMLMKIPNPVM